MTRPLKVLLPEARETRMSPAVPVLERVRALLPEMTPVSTGLLEPEERELVRVRGEARLRAVEMVRL